MAVKYEERATDSPLIESVWRTQVESDGADIVSADVSWDMIISRQNGQTSLTLWGPMTKATLIPHKEGAEHLGLRFKPGTFLANLPVFNQPDSGLVLPHATSRTFWLGGAAWEYPDFENVEAFINRLVRQELLGRDAVVEAALQGHEPDLSPRSVQRRFLNVTGLTQRYIRAIARAQHAVNLLNNGTAILDTVELAGYADQQHLTKALKQLQGQTPAQILRRNSFK